MEARGDRARPSATRVVGYVGEGVAVLFAVVLFASGPSWSAVQVGAWILFVGWCSWVVLVRPQVSVEDGAIVLRNSLLDLRIPSRLVDEVTVRSYLVLRVGKKRYTSTAVGYRPSSVMRGHADLARGLVNENGRTRIESPVAYTRDYLEAEVARARSSVPRAEDRVSRSLAVLPLLALAGVAALLLASSLLA